MATSSKAAIDKPLALILNERIIWITVKPALAGFARGNHRVFIAQCVFRCVTVWRTVTTPSRTACLAGAQMNPGRTKLHALVTLTNLRRSYRLDFLDMNASIIGHDYEPIIATGASIGTSIAPV